MNNALVLSETLNAKAVEILVSVAIAERFPEQCSKWRTRTHGARSTFTQELEERKETIRMEVIRREDSLRGLLREVVVDDVMKVFPWVLADGLFGPCANSTTRAQVIGA